MNLKSFIAISFFLSVMIIGGCTQNAPTPTPSATAAGDTESSQTPSASPSVNPSSLATPAPSEDSTSSPSVSPDNDQSSPVANPSPAASASSLPKESAAPSDNPASSDEPSPTPLAKIDFLKIDVEPTKVAKDLGLDKITPEIYINKELSQAKLKLTLNKSQREPLPENSMLKAWVIDSAKGDPNSSVSDNDTKNGRSFVSLMTDEDYDSLPFSQTLGAFSFDKDPKENDEVNYTVNLRYNNELTPYDKIMITIETGVDTKDINPRPGTPVWTGSLNGDFEVVKKEEVPRPPILFYFDKDSNAFSLTDNTKDLGVETAKGTIQMSTGYGRCFVRLSFDKKPNIPDGSVFEAWLVDNYSNNPHNEDLGPSFQDNAISEKLRNSPYVMSLGKFKFQYESEAEGYVYFANSTIALPLSSFDSVYFTIETDGNSGNYDPRPGSELMYSSISN